MMKSDFTKGQTITYTKEIMFKGTIEISAKIVAIGRISLLLDNGDEISIF